MALGHESVTLGDPRTLNARAVRGRRLAAGRAMRARGARANLPTQRTCSGNGWNRTVCSWAFHRCMVLGVRHACISFDSAAEDGAAELRLLIFSPGFQPNTPIARRAARASGPGCPPSALGHNPDAEPDHPRNFSGSWGRLGHAITRTSYLPREQSRQPRRKPEQRKSRKWRYCSTTRHYGEEGCQATTQRSEP